MPLPTAARISARFMPNVCEPVSGRAARRSATSDPGDRTDVGQHVPGVGQQRQGVREERRHHLERHEGGEEAEGDGQVSMIGLRPTTWRGAWPWRRGRRRGRGVAVVGVPWSWPAHRGRGRRLRIACHVTVPSSSGCGARPSPVRPASRGRRATGPLRPVAARGRRRPRSRSGCRHVGCGPAGPAAAWPGAARPRRLGPDELRQLIDRVLAVEQGPDDAQPGLVTEELEHAHGGLELVLRGNHIYLRSHADSLPREAGTAARGHAAPRGNRPAWREA